MTQMARISAGRLTRTVVLGATLVIAAAGITAAPAAAATNQISGVGVLDTTGECLDPPTGYEDFTIVMTGSLVGCWYTDIVIAIDHGSPSGIYQERGQEIFVGSLDGGPEGTFATTYKFNSKWDPDVSTGSEVHGRCQHPIIAGSGTGGFEGVTGRVDFKDDVVTGEFLYRGHMKRP
jgi:hypothetical protein